LFLHRFVLGGGVVWCFFFDRLIGFLFSTNYSKKGHRLLEHFFVLMYLKVSNQAVIFSEDMLPRPNKKELKPDSVLIMSELPISG